MHYKRLIYFLVLPFFFLSYVSGLEARFESLRPIVNTLVDIAENHKQDSSKAVPIIAIGGCPGVGKTYLTKILLTELQESGVNCIVLPLDHFNLSPEERKKIGTEWDIRHFKARELYDCLASIFSGEKNIKKPTCNQLTGKIGAEVLDLNNIDLILFDGLYALCSKPPLNFFDYCLEGVFLEADESDIYKWKWEREQKKIQPRTPEQFAKHMKALFIEYHQNIEYSKENASFIIRKDSNHNYELEIQASENLKTSLLEAA